MPPKVKTSEQERQPSQRRLAAKPQSSSASSAALPPSEEQISSLEDLSFINITDPLQSRSQRARKFVRAQVMKTFARGRREEKARAETGSEDSTASTNIKFRTLAGRTRALSSAKGRGRGSLPSTVTSRNPRVQRTTWPVVSEPESEALKSHCFSPAFRANFPLYMISLLASRPDAELYPFSIDIDSPAEFPDPDVDNNKLFQLADGSACLAHALLTVSASHLALRQINKARNERQLLYHKSRALELLKEAIEDADISDGLEATITAAVLASHELVVGDHQAWSIHVLGVSRMVEVRGGILRLAEDTSIRRVILWPDQMGALLLNIRPAFQYSAATTSSGVWQQVVQSLQDDLQLPQPFHDMQAAQNWSSDLIDILADIAFITSQGAETILPLVQDSVHNLVDIRDSFIHRLLDLAPQSNGYGGDDEPSHSPEENVRLSVLLLTLERLFSPVLPSAYFQLTHMIADRLAETLGASLSYHYWSGHEWVALWICFVGTSASSNNPRTRSSFVSVAANLSLSLFRSIEQMLSELEPGLRAFALSSKVYGSEMMESFAEDLRVELGAQGAEA